MLCIINIVELKKYETKAKGYCKFALNCVNYLRIM